MSDDKPVVETTEELKSKVIEEFGLDEETQDELIEKLVQDKIEAQKKLSKTIEQKAKYRELGVKAGVLDPETFEPIVKKPDGKQETKPVKKEDLETNSTKEQPISLEEVDKRIFLSNGGDVEDLKVLETIKKGKNISLAEAQQDELYKLYLEKKEADKKKEEAQLSASKKTGSVKQKKMTPEEEKADIMKAAQEVLKNF